MPFNEQDKLEMLNDLPQGWAVAFGRQMCDELVAKLRELGRFDEFEVIQTKEKVGELRVYYTPYIEEIDAIIEKYAALSRKTCIACGAHATKQSLGWISPWCDKHAPEKSIPI